MVSSSSIAFMYISLGISFLFPIALVIYFYIRQRISIAAVFIGAAVFFVFQLLLRTPIIAVLSLQVWYIRMARNPLFTSLFLGLTAGLFEEIGRFLGLRFLLRKKLERKNGIAFGIGHGGIEAMFTLGISSLVNIVYSNIINSGQFDAMISSKVPSEVADTIRNSLLNTPSYVFGLGAVERIFAIIIQIGLSLLVLYGVMRRDFKYVVIAILLHTLIDSPLPYIAKYGPIISEAYIGLCAAVSLIFIIKSRSVFENIE